MAREIHIGKYAVETRPVQQGEIYSHHRARDLEADAPAFAKKLQDGLEHRVSLVKRCLAAARAVEPLDHPNIVKLRHIDSDAILVMDYVDGASLHDLLRRGRQLTLAEAREIVRGVADAVACAHGREPDCVLHLDVKPSNILIATPSGGITRQQVKVVDFGLAQVLPLATRTARVAAQEMGSVHYMAPEQFEHVAARASDVYSIGAVYYQLLTGRLPFEGATAQAIAHKHRHEASTPPRTANPQVPQQDSDIVIRCLAKARGDRFHDAGQLRDALQAFDEPGILDEPTAVLEAEAILLPTPAVTVAPRRGRRLVRWAAWTGALLAVAAAGAWLAGPWLLSAAFRPRYEIRWETLRLDPTDTPVGIELSVRPTFLGALHGWRHVGRLAEGKPLPPFRSWFTHFEPIELRFSDGLCRSFDARFRPTRTGSFPAVRFGGMSFAELARASERTPAVAPEGLGKYLDAVLSPGALGRTRSLPGLERCVARATRLVRAHPQAAPEKTALVAALGPPVGALRRAAVALADGDVGEARASLGKAKQAWEAARAKAPKNLPDGLPLARVLDEAVQTVQRQEERAQAFLTWLQPGTDAEGDYVAAAREVARLAALAPAKTCFDRMLADHEAGTLELVWGDDGELRPDCRVPEELVERYAGRDDPPLPALAAVRYYCEKLDELLSDAPPLGPPANGGMQGGAGLAYHTAVLKLLGGVSQAFDAAAAGADHALAPHLLKSFTRGERRSLALARAFWRDIHQRRLDDTVERCLKLARERLAQAPEPDAVARDLAAGERALERLARVADGLQALAASPRLRDQQAREAQKLLAACTRRRATLRERLPATQEAIERGLKRELAAIESALDNALVPEPGGGFRPHRHHATPAATKGLRQQIEALAVPAGQRFEPMRTRQRACVQRLAALEKALADLGRDLTRLSAEKPEQALSDLPGWSRVLGEEAARRLVRQAADRVLAGLEADVAKLIAEGPAKEVRPSRASATPEARGATRRRLEQLQAHRAEVFAEPEARAKLQTLAERLAALDAAVDKIAPRIAATDPADLQKALAEADGWKAVLGDPAHRELVEGLRRRAQLGWEQQVAALGQRVGALLQRDAGGKVQPHPTAATPAERQAARDELDRLTKKARSEQDRKTLEASTQQLAALEGAVAALTQSITRLAQQDPKNALAQLDTWQRVLAPDRVATLRSEAARNHLAALEADLKKMVQRDAGGTVQPHPANATVAARKALAERVAEVAEGRLAALFRREGHAARIAMLTGQLHALEAAVQTLGQSLVALAKKDARSTRDRLARWDSVLTPDQRGQIREALADTTHAVEARFRTFEIQLAAILKRSTAEGIQPDPRTATPEARTAVRKVLQRIDKTLLGPDAQTRYATRAKELDALDAAAAAKGDALARLADTKPDDALEQLETWSRVLGKARDLAVTRRATTALRTRAEKPIEAGQFAEALTALRAIARKPKVGEHRDDPAVKKELAAAGQALSYCEGQLALRRGPEGFEQAAAKFQAAGACRDAPTLCGHLQAFRDARGHPNRTRARTLLAELKARLGLHAVIRQAIDRALIELAPIPKPADCVTAFYQALGDANLASLKQCLQTAGGGAAEAGRLQAFLESVERLKVEGLTIAKAGDEGPKEAALVSRCVLKFVLKSTGTMETIEHRVRWSLRRDSPRGPWRVAAWEVVD